MKSNFFPVLIIAALILIAGWFVLGGSSANEETVTVAESTSDGSSEARNSFDEPTPPPPPASPDVQSTNVAGESEITDKAAGVYATFTEEKLANAEGDVVLFFHSESCSSCKATEKDLTEKMLEIPSDLTVLQLDFNSETDEDIELRKKYGVTTYHTFVQVDSEGTQVKKWSGTRSLDAIEGELI